MVLYRAVKSGKISSFILTNLYSTKRHWKSVTTGATLQGLCVILFQSCYCTGHEICTGNTIRPKWPQLLWHFQKYSVNGFFFNCQPVNTASGNGAQYRHKRCRTTAALLEIYVVKKSLGCFVPFWIVAFSDESHSVVQLWSTASAMWVIWRPRRPQLPTNKLTPIHVESYEITYHKFSDFTSAVHLSAEKAPYHTLLSTNAGAALLELSCAGRWRMGKYTVTSCQRHPFIL